MTEKSKSLAKWSMIVGTLGLIFFLLALFTFWSDAAIWNFDHKDFYFGGIGFMAIAVWFKLGAIYHKS